MRIGHLLLALLLALAACNGPRGRRVSRERALRWDAPIHVRIRRVYDVLELRGGTDPNITHLIDVERLDEPESPEILSLPYDEWSVGRPPPAAGADLVVAPASWVRKSPDSHGRPNPLFE